MKVTVCPHSGFCPGVKNAEGNLLNLATRPGSERKGICVYGHLIHNREYIQFLEKNGIRTVEDIGEIDSNDVAVIRTHGLDRGREAELRRGRAVIDLTCFKVKRLQQYVERHAKDGYYIVISGKKDHPEVLGLISYARGYTVIASDDDLTAFLNGGAETSVLGKGYKKVLVCSQTTEKRDLFEKTAMEVEGRLGGRCEVKIHDSICSITSQREKEAVKIQKGVDVTFVIGDRLSSNAKKLYLALKKHSEETYFIGNLKELQELPVELINFRSAQVVSSSSTPDFLEKEITRYLEGV